jgi:hypothetical protein
VFAFVFSFVLVFVFVFLVTLFFDLRVVLTRTTLDKAIAREAGDDASIVAAGTVCVTRPMLDLAGVVVAGIHAHARSLRDTAFVQHARF